MGLLASIFGNNTNIKKDRQKNRNFRVCRIEEMESRDLLSATPYDAPVPPPPIAFEIAFHDDNCHSPVDSFVVTWNGGVEDTRLTQLVINLEGATRLGQDLYFRIDLALFTICEDDVARWSDTNNGIHFEISDIQEIIDGQWGGKVLTVTFTKDFVFDPESPTFSADVVQTFFRDR